MSSIAMAADSTQSELLRYKRKAKLARQSNKESKKQPAPTCSEPRKANSRRMKTSKRMRQCENESEDSCSDRDSDLDLSNELLPISGYVGSSELLVTHMFRSISAKKLKAMLPEILKPVPLDELKSLCTEQLEGMSKKRISRILDGDDPDDISSSGTEDDTDVHSFATELKDGDNHTSTDPTNRCSADTTHYESISASEGNGMADDGALATADTSRLTEPADDEDEHLAQSTEAATAAAVQHEIPVEHSAPVKGGENSDTATSLTRDQFEDATGCPELDYDEECEAEQLSDTPGTPASLPSLVSEPEDTCTPVKFVKTWVKNDGDLPLEKSAGDECDLATLPAAEGDSVRQPASPRPVCCADEALASAENENNLNIESENDRPAEAVGTADVFVTAVGNLGSVPADLQLREEKDEVGCQEVADEETPLTEISSIRELADGKNGDTCETESTADHVVLSSCSAMEIEVEDHEFSDEELEQMGKSDNVNHEPAVQLASSKSSVGQHHLQPSVKSLESPDRKLSAVEQAPKNQSTTRVIRLNRSFPQQPVQSVGIDESRAKSPGGNSSQSHRKMLQKSASSSQHPSHDASPERAVLPTGVPCSSDSRSSRPKQLKPDNSSKLAHVSRKLAAPKNLSDKIKTPTTDGGELSEVRVKSRRLQDSVSVTSRKSDPDECRKVQKPRQVSKNLQSATVSEATPSEAADFRDQGEGSRDADSLSKTQLEILELEMRARAIKAMIRAHEKMEQQQFAEKKRTSSDATDLAKLTEKQTHSLPQSSSSGRQPSSTPSRRPVGELRSLQSVVGRNIIKRAEFVARNRRRVAAPEERFPQRSRFVGQRHPPQPVLPTSRRTVKLQADAHRHPLCCVVTGDSSSRIVRVQSARLGVPLPLSRRQQQRRFDVGGNLSSGDSRGDARNVLMSSKRRFVRMSSSSRPY